LNGIKNLVANYVAWSGEPPIVDEFSEADELRAELTKIWGCREYWYKRTCWWAERCEKRGRELEAAQKRIVELEDAAQKPTEDIEYERANNTWGAVVSRIFEVEEAAREHVAEPEKSCKTCRFGDTDGLCAKLSSLVAGWCRKAGHSHWASRELDTEPVKSCETCRFGDEDGCAKLGQWPPFIAYHCVEQGFSKWEPKS